MGGYHEHLAREARERAMKNTVTQAHVDAQIVDISVSTIFDKVTVVAVRLKNGFVLVESAGAVDKANYSEAIGREICLARIKNKIWELEGYVLSTALQYQRIASEFSERAMTDLRNGEATLHGETLRAFEQLVAQCGISAEL